MKVYSYMNFGIGGAIWSGLNKFADAVTPLGRIGSTITSVIPAANMLYGQYQQMKAADAAEEAAEQQRQQQAQANAKAQATSEAVANEAEERARDAKAAAYDKIMEVKDRKDQD